MVSLTGLFFIYCTVFGGILEKYVEKIKLKPVSKIFVLQKFLGMFMNNMSIEVSVVFFKHILPDISFCNEKVCKTSDK